MSHEGFTYRTMSDEKCVKFVSFVGALVSTGLRWNNKRFDAPVYHEVTLNKIIMLV